ncbi:hypothetical protein LZQ00_16435 [Sphingobacterium sp. SRCM116780]|uniref:hypothetical protein n=1 Tax=Sphingobacterium sp. SRCM116780 TaxID=2907623 RepID=UPI001F1BA897|nr:hypothetical protein [Sphingobacterium sp. SRCM116780]UIR55835.1 hypothetical protein LZQ00_16435 [Sphingobacterium sp. SRCM116780]
MQIYKKLLLLSSATIALYFSEMAINIACGPEIDPYDNQQTYFLPNLEDNSFSAFQFIPYQFLYTEQEPISEAKVNVNDWINHLGATVKEKDVLAMMYEANQETTLLLHEKTDLKTLPDSVKDNSFVQRLLLKENKAELEYFNFTKDQEPITNIAQDPWSPDERNFDEIEAFAKKAEGNIFNFKKNSFLQIRYAYQAARLYLFAKKYEKSIAIYEKHLANAKSKSPVLGWALSNYAGSIRKNGDPAKAAFLFSKVFTKSPERRILAYDNFHYITVADAEIFAFAKSKADQFNINAMIGFNDPNSNDEYLQNCYRLDPANTINVVLLTREVNKIENYFIKPHLLGYGYSSWYEDENKANIQKHLQDIRALSLKIYEDKKYVQPQLGLITASYLSWLNGENDLAKQYLKMVKTKSLNENLKDQFRITGMLTQLTDWEKDKSLDEDQLIATLRWLQEKSQKEQVKGSDDRYYSAFANGSYSLISRNILQNIVVNQYLIKKDTALASLAAVKADIFYNYGFVKDTLEDNLQYGTVEFWQNSLTPKTLIQVQEYIEKPERHSKMVQFLLEDIKKVNKTYLTELLGTAYLRELDFTNAVKTFKKLPVTYKSKEYSNWYSEEVIAPNPFIVTINDYPKRYDLTAMTKLEYAARMLKFQNLIKSETRNGKKADYYFQMANALYQTSTYGNAWSLVSYDWSSYDNNTKPENYWKRNYTQTKTAKEWYAKARELGSDPNFKAKCTFMLAKCEQKDYELNDESRWKYYASSAENPFYQFSIHNKYFHQLKDQYSTTAFYQVAARECTYLQDFIAKK